MLKKENLLKIVEKQIKLDKNILEKKELIMNETLISKKIVALLVELAEFINEERSFKYWSQKPASELNVLLEEYIDGIHFIISLGTNINFDFKKYNFRFIFDEITTAYLKTFTTIISFNKEKTTENYKKMLDSFFSIGKILDFTEEDLIKAYEQKNKINFTRQEDNY